MNNTEVLTKIAEKTGFSFEDCEKVMKGFEQTSGIFMKNKAGVSEKVSQNTEIAVEKCEAILKAFEEVFGDGLTDKFTFLKKKDAE